MSENWGPLLVAAARRDLEVRARLAASGELFDGYNPEMEKVHDENGALLARVFDDIGWPGRRVEQRPSGGTPHTAPHAAPHAGPHSAVRGG